MIAEEVVARAFAGWDATSPPPTHREFAKRTLLPGGPLKGTSYDPATDPVQNYFCDQLDSGQWESLTFGSCPQIAGKTTIGIVVPLLRGAIGLRCDVGYGLPTLEDLDRGWQTKIAPTFKKAGMGAYLPEKGPGSKGGRPPSLYLEDPNNHRAQLGGIVFLAGGAKQITARIIALDELDAWRDADGTPRWSDIEDAWARADSFQGDAIRIGTGTLECDIPAKSILLTLINQKGTGTRMAPLCRHCGSFRRASFDNFVFEYSVTSGGDSGPDLRRAAETAAYICPVCAVRWSEDDRRWALLHAKFPHKSQEVDDSGEISGAAPGTRHFGLRTHALDCIITTMGAIAEKSALARFALETHGNHEPMRKFWRYQRVECYSGDVQADEDKTAPLTHAVLAERSKRTAWSIVGENKDEVGLFSRYAAELPEAADFGVGAMDIQHNRLYHASIGANADERTWDTSWGIDYAHAGDESRQPAPFGPGEFTITADRTADWMESLWGDKFRIGVIDTGDQAAPFVAEIEAWLRRRPKWRACRGVDNLPRIKIDGSEQAFEPRIDGLVCWEKVWRPGLGRYLIGSEASWRSFQSAHRRDPGSPGAAALPGPLKAGNFYLRHITAKGEAQNKSGATVFKTQPGGGRHDLGDCRGYSHAVALALIRCKQPAERESPAIPALNDPFFRRL